MNQKLLPILRFVVNNIYIVILINFVGGIIYMIVAKFYSFSGRTKAILLLFFLSPLIIGVPINNYYEYYLRKYMKNKIMQILKDDNYTIKINNKIVGDKDILKNFIDLRSTIHENTTSKECHNIKLITESEKIKFKICLDERFNYQNWVFSDFFNKNKNFEAIGIINSRELYKKLDAFK